MVKTASLYDNFCKTGNYVIYFPKVLGVRVKISITLYVDPEGAYVVKFWQLGPFLRKKIPKF